MKIQNNRVHEGQEPNLIDDWADGSLHLLLLKISKLKLLRKLIEGSWQKTDLESTTAKKWPRGCEIKMNKIPILFLFFSFYFCFLGGHI